VAAAPVLAAEPLCEALTALGRGAEALRRGDPATSLPAARQARSALPHGPIGASAAATQGLALLASERPAEAIEPLQAALVAPPGGLEGTLRLALGRALVGAGRPAEALPVLADAAQRGPASVSLGARWLEAEGLLAAGRVGLAAQRLEGLLGAGSDDGQARRGRLLLAGARRLAGREDEALALYRGLALDEPDRPEGAEAAAALGGWAAAGGARARLGGDDRLRRAERLLQRGRPAEALAEVGLAAGSLPPAPAEPSALVQLLALAGLDRFAEAVELARPLAASRHPGVRRGALWLLARAASRAGQVEEATSLYAQVAEGQAQVPGLGERRSRELGDEAAYLAAWLWYDAADYQKATARLDAFARARPASPRADDAQWFAAWSSLRAGDRRGALTRLSRLERGPLADAALYWQGRLGGNRERLRRAALAAGDGWYGWLARSRLAALGAAPPPAPAVELRPPGPLEAASAGRLASASALLSLGWRDAGVAALEALAQRGASRATAVEICRLATFAGEPALAFRVARDLLGQARASERWLFPAAFEPEVAAAARGAGVDETLLFALLRRESAFRPEARSLAGAVGLGQLLPRTADRLGLLGGLSGSTVDRLEDPATNLPLAALYLGLLGERFGSDAGAVAAYNAGPGPPAAWSAARAGQPLDEWVENIPYKETRVYVKTVLSTREVYRRLAGLQPLLDAAARIPAAGAGVAF
jgi:soluble lytic murein transglycosylase